MVEPITPVLGGVLKLRVDSFRVKIGMEAVFESAATGLVKARIEDVAAGQVVARVTTAPSAPFTLPANTSMRLQTAVTYSTR